jgi:glutamate carboxypeptidase
VSIDRLFAYAKEHPRQLVALLREFVECESPSDDAAAVGRFMELVAVRIGEAGKVRLTKPGKFGPNLLCEFSLPGPKRKDGQILALGHGDTVWPVGTLRQMPWRERDGRLWGPGIFDMKAGLAFFLFAMRGLRELDIPVRRRVLLQVNSDEEIGSDGSRALTERNAKASVAVLVLEPSAGPDGKLKTARKGVGDYRVRVTGKPAHSGLDFGAGASAILELARQIERIAGFTDLERGITVNPGVIRGGTRTNVVAAEAEADFDMRVVKARDAIGLDRKFRGLKPVDKRCRIEVSGGMNRPPLERSAGVVRLLREAQKVAAQLGVELGETSVGGGSDGNFTAGLGIPTLDGLGAVGEGAHAANESILVSRIADRVALHAGLAASL